jgi:hypothetical protein
MGPNSPPLAYRVGKLCGITWNKNTISLALFHSRLHFRSLWLGPLKGLGGRITKSKIYGQTPIIYVLQPNTTMTPTHMCKLVDTFYNIQFVAQAWSSSLKLYVAQAKWFWPRILALFAEAIKLCTSERRV